jgi:hypothetical protein
MARTESGAPYLKFRAFDVPSAFGLRHSDFGIVIAAAVIFGDRISITIESTSRSFQTHLRIMMRQFVS